MTAENSSVADSISLKACFPFCLEFPVSGVSGYAGPIRHSIVELLGNLIQSRTLFN